MTKAEKKNLIGTNCAIWAAGILLSFVLPLVTDSITEGRGNFISMQMHVYPLLCTMFITSNLLSKAIGAPTDNEPAET